MEVQLKSIRKYFGPVKANDGITLSVPAGTIQGILGENGAGKSTLMKILSGFQPADSGTIELDGRVATMRSPADAIRHGVGMLHQDPLDFPPMRVVDNLLIGAPGRVIPRREEAAAVLARRYGISEQTLYRWRDEFLSAGEAALLAAKGGADARNRQIEELKRELARRDQVIGELTIANRLLKKSSDGLL